MRGDGQNQLKISAPHPMTETYRLISLLAALISLDSPFKVTYCVAGNRKNSFIFLLQSQNNCVKISGHQKLCNPQRGPAGRCKTQLGLPNMFCWRSKSSLPPPPAWLTSWYAGRAKYTECWGTIPQYTGAVTRSWNTMVLTTSSLSSSSAASSYPKEE